MNINQASLAYSSIAKLKYYRLPNDKSQKVKKVLKKLKVIVTEYAEVIEDIARDFGVKSERDAGGNLSINFQKDNATADELDSIAKCRDYITKHNTTYDRVLDCDVNFLTEDELSVLLEGSEITFFEDESIESLLKTQAV
jgi:hypothetical protein